MHHVGDVCTFTVNNLKVSGRARVKFAITAVFLAFFRLSAAAQGLSATADDGREVPSTPAVSTASVFAPPFDAILAPSAPTLAFTPMPVFAPMASAFVVLKTPPPTHKFFDVRNSLGLTALASSLIADALSTQKGLAYPGFHEMNPIARPFVQTRAGAAGYTAGSFALLTGAMYAAHKTRHHKLEHILPFAVASWETGLSARNYHLIATNKK
jgi:hypothetical protein